MNEAGLPRDPLAAPDEPSRESPVSQDDELLLQIIRGARLTLWAADDAEENFAIRLWNKGAEHIYGYTRAEALGRNYIELFVNPDERDNAISDHEQVLHGAIGLELEAAVENVAVRRERPCEALAHNDYAA